MLRSTLLVLLVFACAASVGVVVPGAAEAHPQDSALDGDHDGVNDPPVGTDNCAGEDGAFNPNQADLDQDGLGDECDTDDDGDTVDDALDNCRNVPNQAQADLDGDNIGDVCDVDDDGDGLADSRDNCRFVPNPDQADADRDGLGDECDEAPPGGTTRPPGGGGGPGPGGTPDGAAPDVSVPVRTTHRTGELGAGLPVPVTCSERCTVSARLSLTARDARRLRVRRLLGSGGAELDAAGSTFAFVAVSTRALRRARRVRVLLTIDVADAAGNRRTMTRRLTIRR
jgi:hypothetical protein